MAVATVKNKIHASDTLYSKKRQTAMAVYTRAEMTMSKYVLKRDVASVGGESPSFSVIL
jgi:hypothetical protein